MNISISDPQTKKAYSKKVDEIPATLMNQKIGATIKLDEVGLNGFEAKITGGSDTDGFPMRPSLIGLGRKKIFSFKGIGFRQTRKGERRRKSVRGNTISSHTAQVNLVITKNGSTKIEQIFGKEPKKEEPKKSVKEEMVAKSLAAVGDDSMAEEAKKIKGKIKG
ncbi:30S ribosomal protein S6e [Candidatus Micrarchaeota archaeon]|nr:30S ribosomal protein S6e [Candidatus Micrarchaeota archaeon]MBU1930062.1 30S ribosomal protein S6e [Candidatus Micrarchaeota archaeon]